MVLLEQNVVLRHAGIYKITNGETVLKWHAFFRVALVPLFFLLLQLLVVADFDSDEFVDNNRETKAFLLFISWDERDKEFNNRIRHIFSHHRLQPRSFFSLYQPPAIDRSAMASTSASISTYAIAPPPPHRSLNATGDLPRYCPIPV